MLSQVRMLLKRGLRAAWKVAAKIANVLMNQPNLQPSAKDITTHKEINAG
jgi:hypothetical protein